MLAERGLGTTPTIQLRTTGDDPSQISHDLLPHMTPNPTLRPGVTNESLTTYLEPRQINDICEDAGLVDDGLLNFLQRTRNIICNVGYTIGDIVLLLNATVGTVNNTFRAIKKWSQNV